MLPLRTVVCAIDFTDASAPALIEAADLAERAHADLHLVHVDPMFRARLANTSGSESRLYQRTHDWVNETLGADDAFEVLAPTVRVLHGEAPSDGVVHFATEVGADLIVAGRHDRRSLDHVILGSVSRGVVRGSAIPVLVVPSPVTGAVRPGPDRPVLVAADFSSHTPAAVRLAAGLAETFGASVELAHVVEGSRSAPLDLGGLFTLSDLRLEPSTGARSVARAALNRLAADSDAPVTEQIVATGSADAELVRLATERRAGCVVMGTHGRRGWDRARLGSVAEWVARYAPCPVLVIPTVAAEAVHEEAADLAS